MSYDLHFYSKLGAPVPERDIRQYLNRLPHTTRTGHDSWFYRNEETGAYCAFDYSDPTFWEAMDEEDDSAGQRFTEFAATGFSFNVNYIRPQFFGKECFPLVARFASELNLFISNPQREGKPEAPDADALEAEWAGCNLRFSKIYMQQGGLSYLDQARSDYTWSFCFHRAELQARLGNGYFVPSIFYIQPKGTQEVKTLAVWPEHIPYVLPRVDLVLIQRRAKRFFRTREESGLISYDALLRKLHPHFEAQSDYHIIHPQKAQEIGKTFNALPLEGRLEEYGKGIALEHIVNVR
ncbi:MAG: hypothetical protein AAFV07_18975 [Bacteroidota bacterium]